MAIELKKIGHNISLKGLIIHQVIKEQNDKNVTLKQAKNEIVCGDKEKFFIGTINNAYDKKSNPTYGTFGNDDETFKNLLKNYCEEGSFMDFSVSAVKYYQKVIKVVTAATGGFVIFAHFLNTDSNNEYMLVLTINNKNGYVVNETDLTIKDIKNLDINKLDVACRINLTKWTNVEQGIDLNSKTYLSFVRGNKDISYYFMSFIDCANKKTSTESSKCLYNALTAYYVVKKVDKDKKKEMNKIALDYCDDCNRQRIGISLSTLSDLLDPKNPNDFKEFAASEEYGVDETISYDGTVLKKLGVVKYKGKNWSIEFSKELINETIFYDENENTITIKDIPIDVRSQIKI